MTEYEEITNGKTVEELRKELNYQLSLGYDVTDSFPAYIIDRIAKLQYNASRNDIKGTINYGFGREYLKHWSIKEALREVFQNYIDYGDYDIVKTKIDSDNYKVVITNKYVPENLEFLRIGNSQKHDSKAIGHHGEGLKMAFLIFLRENLDFKIVTNNWILTPEWNKDTVIGDTFRINYVSHENSEYFNHFTTEFVSPVSLFDEFESNIVKPVDVILSTPYGEVVHKPMGNIYSGGLFVCFVKDIHYSYNIPPSSLPLDRDRSVPKDFDLDYSISRILNIFNKIANKAVLLQGTIPLTSRDYSYASNVSEEDIKHVSKVIVNNKPKFLDKRSNKFIEHGGIISTLEAHPKFKKDILKNAKFKLQQKINNAKKKSILTLVKEFKSKYSFSDEVSEDLDVILKVIKFKSKSKSKHSKNIQLS